MRRFVRAGGLVRAGSDPNHGMPALDIHEEVTMFVEAESRRCKPSKQLRSM
jgi:hypothetical protein